MRYRWIMHVSQNSSGNRTFDVKRVTNLNEAKEGYIDFCGAVNVDECTALLYVYSEESWESAKEMEGMGCLFKSPDKRIERGGRGAIVIRNS